MLHMNLLCLALVSSHPSKSWLTKLALGCLLTTRRWRTSPPRGLLWILSCMGRFLLPYLDPRDGLLLPYSLTWIHHSFYSCGTHRHPGCTNRASTYTSSSPYFGSSYRTLTTSFPPSWAKEVEGEEDNDAKGMGSDGPSSRYRSVCPQDCKQLLIPSRPNLLYFFFHFI